MDSTGIMILALPRSKRQDASPLWAIVPEELRDGFNNTRALDVPGEHVHTDGSPRIGTPYNRFGG
jgi:hypothetical protein